MAQVAATIKGRNWTQARAAEFLGVTQPRISDLMRGQSHRFTVDSLIEMLYALSRPVELRVEGEPMSGRRYPTLKNAELADLVEFYTEVIKQNPKDIDALARRADAYEQQGLYDKALADYEKCHKLDPGRPALYANSVNVLLSARRYQEAIDFCKELLERYPDLDIYNNRGLAHQALGNDPAALEDFTRAIQLEPTRPGAYWNRARVHERLENYAASIQDFLHYSSLAPNPGEMQKSFMEVERLRALQRSQN